MITNGSLLEEKHFKFLKNYKIGLALSHDGIFQKKLRGSDYFEDKNIVNIIKKFNEIENTTINTVLNNYNCNFIERIFIFWWNLKEI